MVLPGNCIRIVVASRPVEFRNGPDDLAAVIQKQLGFAPHSVSLGRNASESRDRTICRAQLLASPFSGVFDALDRTHMALAITEHDKSLALWLGRPRCSCFALSFPIRFDKGGTYRN